ncbi:MAG: glutamate--cysteine ligase [Candidatus Deianiraeaceae bacterium]|jgi:glutamate--cysteine ligase
MLNTDILDKGYKFLEKHSYSELLYNSIDVRQSSFKTVPVDNNIFPAGFNNLAVESLVAFGKYLEVYVRENNIKTVLIVTEDHTRNVGYLKNVKVLFDVITKVGLDVNIATLTLDAHDAEINGGNFEIHKLEIIDNKVGVQNMPKPDLIILNNDLSSETHTSIILQTMFEMNNILPLPKMGWNNRKKSLHFKAYQDLAVQFADYAGFDPWFINAEFTTAQCLDFTNKTELQNLADATSDVFKKIKQKYKEYSIIQEPAVFLKSESGTYGLGVEKVSNPKDLLNPNRTFRKKILYNKSKVLNTEFLLQEAVPTEITHSGGTAECTIYTTLGKAFGGFYRIHKEKHSMDNLNSKGAEFSPLEITKAQEPSYLNFIAMLSTVAVSMEEF